MKTSMLLVMLAALPGVLRAEAGTPVFNQLSNCPDGSACFGPSNAAPSVPEYGSTGQSSSGLSASSRVNSNLAVSEMPYAGQPVQPKKPSFLKSHEKLMLGLVLGGVGGYAGFVNAATWALGPYKMVAIGAVVGLIVGMIVIPKLLGLFHHHKKG
jgi:hypothetical protein